jgi:23S rRNA (guanosine2251-2'-O)-methyltransferase
MPRNRQRQRQLSLVAGERLAPASSPAGSRLVLGIQPVTEAVRKHGPNLRKLLLEGGKERLDRLESFARHAGVVAIERVARSELDRLASGVAHQGVAAWAPALEFVGLERVLEQPPFLGVALDGVEDPQNFGAILRSAVAIANAPIIWGEHGAAPLTPATFRASAGAIEHACLVRVSSLRQALLDCRERGAQVVALDAAATSPLHQLELRRPLILVVGSEGRGLKPGVRRACNTSAYLVPRTRIASLNASVAAALALFIAEQNSINSLV